MEPPQNSEARAHYCQGTTHLRAGNYDLAIPELQQAVHLEPTFASAHLSLGTAYYFSGHKYEQAVASLQKSLRDANLNVVQACIFKILDDEAQYDNPEG